MINRNNNQTFIANTGFGYYGAPTLTKMQLKEIRCIKFITEIFTYVYSICLPVGKMIESDEFTSRNISRTFWGVSCGLIWILFEHFIREGWQEKFQERSVWSNICGHLLAHIHPFRKLIRISVYVSSQEPRHAIIFCTALNVL